MNISHTETWTQVRDNADHLAMWAKLDGDGLSLYRPHRKNFAEADLTIPIDHLVVAYAESKLVHRCF